MPRSRLSIALYLILVFASGIMVGLVSYRLYSTKTASANAPQPSMSEFRRRYLDGMRTKVGASEAQIQAIMRTLDETKQKFDELAAMEKPMHDRIQQEHVEAIRAILNEQQRIAYDNWRAEREKARQAASQKK